MKLQLAETMLDIQKLTGKSVKEILKETNIHESDFKMGDDETLISVLNSHYKITQIPIVGEIKDGKIEYYAK